MARTGAAGGRSLLREARFYGSGWGMDTSTRSSSGAASREIRWIERDLPSGKNQRSLRCLREARRKTPGHRLLAASLLCPVARHPRRTAPCNGGCVRNAGGEVSDAFDLLIRGGICVMPSGIAAADVGIKGGRIAAIGALPQASALRLQRCE